MCDDAESLAGAGTDVRRCADALGPRKNLHRRVSNRRRCHWYIFQGGTPSRRAPYRWTSHSYGRASYGHTYLMAGYPVGVYPLGVDSRAEIAT
jgi:hypothetical protein